VRRLAAITVLLSALVALVAMLLAGPNAQGSSTYNFDVIFDDARGLIAGQLVKIAGAKAGTISNVQVTPDFKARISAGIDGRFAPFHTDATCTIRPEGLIAENYIDCDPGTPGSPPLVVRGGFPPTVPVTNTTEPVSLLNLFNMFNVPTRERFMVIIDELGIGTAGEGQNLNDILRRANPTLQLADQVISILHHQKNELARLIESTNTIAAATHTTALQNFLDQAAALTSTTTAHSANLALAVNRLPGLLSVTQPSLKELDTFAVNATPLVQTLGATAPELIALHASLGPFVAAAKPGLAELNAALDQAIPALKATTPLIETLNTYLAEALPSTQLMGRLFTNLQATGFSENFLSVLYYVAAASARHDSTSHILGLHAIAPNGGACSVYATTPVAGCSAHYGAGPVYTPVPATATHRDQSKTKTAAAPQAARTGTAPGSTTPTAGTPAKPVQNLVSQETALARKLIAKLVQGGGQSAGKVLRALQGALHGSGSNSSQTLQNLTNYLLR
jgi:ABC-type transporter Mla subunit MlaD